MTVPPRTPVPPPPLGSAGVLAKALLLGLALALAIWGAFPLVEQRDWLALAVLVAATALIFWVYLAKRRIPAKYLLPGTLFLIAFQVLPILYTVSTAFTNFGDGHRGSKQAAIHSIEEASVSPVPGTPDYRLNLAVDKGSSPLDGPLVLLLTDPATGKERAARADRGTVTDLASRDALTVLTDPQAARRGAELAALRIADGAGAIRTEGLERAYVGAPARRYDASSDTLRDTKTGTVWKADDTTGTFVTDAGERISSGWRVNVGLKNFADVLTNPTISAYFGQTLVWNIAFAVLTVLITFVLGLFVALSLHHPRMRGRWFYRALLILPYAMPAFAMLMVWADMFNKDFGLINRLFGLDVNWLGEAWTARLAVLLVQLWMGYPYMFLVATGALQAVPDEVKEAARVDGAGRWTILRKVTLPLVLVALFPLLIASFAFNFNNFNAIYLTTAGGPFPPDSPMAGATDLLITYTYRLAFGGQGAQYGLAAAISLFIFVIVAVISLVSFRRARALEEVTH
ncbi:ABC transporter permease subunit [Streptomyces sp. NPDC087440]|uniref:ABC transporter permease subunit n=1 Tax=Streptomyces sp. NPDC087440 TaxID=3365790 RepID=UPI0037FC2D6E